MIDWEHLPDDLVRALKTLPQSAGYAGGMAVDPALDLRSVSRQTISRTVADCDGNLSEAARRLGISRNTLYRKLRD